MTGAPVAPCESAPDAAAAETGDCTMPDRETVEGWSNYPTWAVNLWLANDRKLSEQARSKVRAVSTTAPRSEWDDVHRGDVARMLQVWVTVDLMPDRLQGIYADLLSYAVGEVDWYELAAEWISNSAEVPT